MNWFLTVFIIYQIYAFFISKQKTEFTHTKLNKFYFLEPVIIYCIVATEFLLLPLTMSDHQEIYNSMALITFFTMIFIVILALISFSNSENEI